MKRPKASRRVGSVGVSGMSAAKRTEVVPRTAIAEEIAGACSELQSRQWLLELFDKGLENGALGNASS